MNIKPMQMSWSYNGKARPEIKSPTTFDAILAGERTATTRFPYFYDRNWQPGNALPRTYENYKMITPGTQLEFYSGDRRVKANAVATNLSSNQGFGGSSYRLTYQDMIDNPQWLERWSKREGWTPREGADLFRKYHEGVQIPFELVGDSPIATPASRPLVLNTHPQGTPNPMNSPWLIKNNIYSKSPDPFLQALTNPTLRANKLKQQYPVEYGGYRFADADSAFFGLREALPEDMGFELLADINAAKFMQHGKLGHELAKRSNGDVEGYFNTLVHRTGKNSPKWEGEGLQSRAIQALNTGYSRSTQGQLTMESQVRDLISKGYSPMESKSLIKYSSQLNRPLASMANPLEGIQRPSILDAQPQVAPNPMNRQSFIQESFGRMASDVLEPRGEVIPQGVASNLGDQYLAMQKSLKARQALESLALFANKYDVPI